MSLELFIALRYLRAKRKGIFATVTSLIGVAGVTVGVAALITTLSVMNGFQADIEKKIIGANKANGADFFTEAAQEEALYGSTIRTRNGQPLSGQDARGELAEITTTHFTSGRCAATVCSTSCPLPLAIIMSSTTAS